MGWYYNSKPTIETDRGIKTKSKRGAFVKNWWATRWLESMEKVMDRGRLQRGRRYARKGQVLSLTEAKGIVTGKVQGSRSRPYVATIEVEPLTEKEWELVIEALAAQPIFMAQLLAGEMPQNIEDAFSSVNLSLFPTTAGGIMQDCNCPDWADVCKHLAAVHYILAERFDEDPFLLFSLRGKTQTEILETLSELSGNGEAEEFTPVYDPPPPLSVDDFWASELESSPFQTHIEPPETPYPVLARLGEPTFLPEVGRWLRPAYDVMSKTAVSTAFDQTDTPEEEENHDNLS